MADHKSADAPLTNPTNASIERSLNLFLPQGGVSAGIHRKALAAAPLALWLLEALRPERVLTVGASCELLHLSLCKAGEAEGEKTTCTHISHDFTDAFTSARMRYGTLRSQLSAANARHPRLGAEGQFDLIFLHLAAAPEAGLIDDWRAGLSRRGVLALHLADSASPDGADAAWTVGEETLALFWAAAAPEDVRNLAPGGGGGETLSAVLAASVASLALGDKRRAKIRYAAEMEALRERHRADLILLTRQLATLEEQVIDQRAKLKEAQAALAAAQAET